MQSEYTNFNNLFLIYSWSSSEFDLNEIRLIVYQDCERRGRQVLFDSTAVRKIDEAVIQVWNVNCAFVLSLFCLPSQNQDFLKQQCQIHNPICDLSLVLSSVIAAPKVLDVCLDSLESVTWYFLIQMCYWNLTNLSLTYFQAK